MRALVAALGLAAAAACIDPMPEPDAGPPDASATALPEPAPNPSRGIDDTALFFDLGERTAVATITFEPSSDAGATLEVGDLQIDSVALGAQSVKFAVGADHRLELGLPASRAPLSVELRYRWNLHEGFSGASMNGYTLTWPYFCGNVFPCHSAPSDGATFSLALAGVPSGKTAVFPARIAAQAPAYQVGWTVAEYTELPLGTTPAGTELVAWYQPGQLDAMRAGSAMLLATFGWLEKAIGPYPFGRRAGPVAANWGPVKGGMEHHPYWHLGALALASVEIQAHEAAHGWFGDGVRLQCWEDFVLSEGTVEYLAARSIEAVAPQEGARVWAAYADELQRIDGAALVWPQTCGAVDILNDRLFTRAVYVRGAFFFRAVALKVGAAALDLALAAFFGAHVGQAASFGELLEVIRIVTGFDPRACAEKWLRGARIPLVAACE